MIFFIEKLIRVLNYEYFVQGNCRLGCTQFKLSQSPGGRVKESGVCVLENLNGSHEEYRSQRGSISIVPF